MTPDRRATLVLLGAVPFAGLGASLARATEELPPGTMRILVGFAAGGAPDALARVVADRLGSLWSRQVIVENRTGAQGNLAMTAVAKAPPDGLTLALVPVGNAAVNPTLFPNLPYDIERDFAPVTQLATVENALVVGSGTSLRTIADLVARGRAEPESLTYATPGAGSLAHLAAELLALGCGIRMRHVPYRGMSPALTDVMRGEVTLTFAQISTAKPLIESGQLRALGVASSTPNALLPGVPTVAEAANLPGFEAVSWYALMAPAGTPQPVVAKLGADAAAVLRDPATRAALEAQGASPVGGTPAELAALIRAEGLRWGKVVRDAGIRVE
jgi:tripartite-type tricarboxylate transporter receptor subunit TctC